MESINVKLLDRLSSGCLLHWDRDSIHKKDSIDVLILHDDVVGCPICRQIKWLEKENEKLITHNDHLTKIVDNYKEQEKAMKTSIKEELINNIFK